MSIPVLPNRIITIISLPPPSQTELLTPLHSLTDLTLSINEASISNSMTSNIASGSGVSGGDSNSDGNYGRLPALLRRRPSLRHVHLQLNGTLTSQLHGELGHQLCNITISGEDAQGLGADALKVGPGSGDHSG